MYFTDKLQTYTLYSYNLTDPSRSFASDITVSDFNRRVYHKELREAKRVQYINPRGTCIILRDKNGSKTS